MKCIIDIPEDVYKNILQRSTEIQAEGNVIECAVLNATPLDNVKEEIDKAYEYVTYRILNNIGKAENEDFPQAEDIEPTVENFSKVLDNKLIGDAIQDCRTDIRGKSCNTCKNNDDEFSGECYECIKGIFDHYEPQESEDK